MFFFLHSSSLTSCNVYLQPSYILFSFLVNSFLAMLKPCLHILYRLLYHFIIIDSLFSWNKFYFFAAKRITNPLRFLKVFVFCVHQNQGLFARDLKDFQEISFAGLRLLHQGGLEMYCVSLFNIKSFVNSIEQCGIGIEKIFTVQCT